MKKKKRPDEHNELTYESEPLQNLSSFKTILEIRLVSPGDDEYTSILFLKT